MDALKKMTAPSAVVKRDGIYKKIPASFVVPGDLVKIEAGDQVPADIRLIKVQGFHTNESAPVSYTHLMPPMRPSLSKIIPPSMFPSIETPLNRAMIPA